MWLQLKFSNSTCFFIHPLLINVKFFLSLPLFSLQIKKLVAISINHFSPSTFSYDSCSFLKRTKSYHMLTSMGPRLTEWFRGSAPRTLLMNWHATEPVGKPRNFSVKGGRRMNIPSVFHKLFSRFLLEKAERRWRTRDSNQGPQDEICKKNYENAIYIQDGRR